MTLKSLPVLLSTRSARGHDRLERRSCGASAQTPRPRLGLTCAVTACLVLAASGCAGPPAPPTVARLAEILGHGRVVEPRLVGSFSYRPCTVPTGPAGSVERARARRCRDGAALAPVAAISTPPATSKAARLKAAPQLVAWLRWLGRNDEPGPTRRQSLPARARLPLPDSGTSMRNR